MKKLTQEKELSYLRQMRQAADVGDLSYDEFVENKARRQAAQLNFVIIGENAGRLIRNQTMKDHHMIFKLSKSMRNFIAHQYETVNLTYVYTTAKQDIPLLIKTIDDYVQSISKENQ